MADGYGAGFPLLLYTRKSAWKSCAVYPKFRITVHLSFWALQEVFKGNEASSIMTSSSIIRLYQADKCISGSTMYRT
jgi:hypothetical protein